MKKTQKTTIPSHLSAQSKDFFKWILSEYDLENHHLRLLRLACEAWDRGQEARKVIKDEGLTFNDRYGQPKPRPEVQIENQCRICFARLMREMQLDIEPPAARPPRIGGN